MKRPPLWASLLTLTGFAILCSLGTWQLQRLGWKTELLAAITAAEAADPMRQELTADYLSALPADTIMVRGFSEGVFLHEAAIRIGPRTHNGRPGHHILTPFETLDNHILLVNRGWVPLDAQDYAQPQDARIITGTARRPDTPNMFVPANNPAAGQWYALRLDDIAAAQGLQNVLPYVLYLDGDDTADQAYPLATAIKWRPNNNHLSYALFWFFMAGTLLVIYYLRFIRPQEA